jgi:histone acetyltransferase
MSPASSVLSDEPPPSKRRRLSSSSLSDAEEDADADADADADGDADADADADADDDDDDDDKPLAAQVADLNAAIGVTSRKAVTQRSGKKTSSMKSKPQTAPTGDKRPEKNGVANGRSPDLKVKVEDKMDEGQLTRLATGVTVDTGPTSSAVPSHKPEKAAFVELRKGIIEITAVENDRQPRSLVILTGLKTLFQTQLPMMPREYIARLVYDHNSKALAIIKRGYKVVGGICYRPFPHRGFAEIVFFATASVDQVKGYGGMLMDNFKQHIKHTYPDVMHFLTYADNFAVVFFKKQGFSKEITLDRSVWAGYIKDYEGGTIMQCTMLRKVNYLDKVSIISQQREAILAKIREMSKSHIVYQGLPQFQEGAPEGITVDPKEVPGLRESGWTPGIEHTTRSGKSAEHTQMQRLLSDLKAHPLAWAFLNPVNADEVPDYYGVIKRPMDFSTMEHKLETNQYSSLKFFLDDVQLVVDNCKLYNPETSIYHRNAVKLEKFMKEQCTEYAKRGS